MNELFLRFVFFVSLSPAPKRLTSYQDQIDSVEKKVHLSIWNDYLEISPLFEFAIVLIPKEFQFYPLHPRNSFSENFDVDFHRLGIFYLLFCEDSRSSHSLRRLRFTSSSSPVFLLSCGKIYQVCHVQSDNEEKRGITGKNRRGKINVTISAWWNEEVKFCCGI
jgi:hypothetical protein